VQEFDLKGRPTTELEKNNKALIAAYGIFDKILED
jgi:hypothetical protein